MLRYFGHFIKLLYQRQQQNTVTLFHFCFIELWAITLQKENSDQDPSLTAQMENMQISRNVSTGFPCHFTLFAVKSYVLNNNWKYMKITYVHCGEEMRYKRSSQLSILQN